MTEWADVGLVVATAGSALFANHLTNRHASREATTKWERDVASQERERADERIREIRSLAADIIADTGSALGFVKVLLESRAEDDDSDERIAPNDLGDTVRRNVARVRVACPDTALAKAVARVVANITSQAVTALTDRQVGIIERRATVDRLEAERSAAIAEVETGLTLLGDED